MSEQAERPISEAFMVASELAYQKAVAEGYDNISAYPGMITVVLDDRWTFDLHAQVQDIDGLPAGTVRINFNGWPAGIVNAYGGVIAAGALANEDTFLAAAKSAMGTEFLLQEEP